MSDESFTGRCPTCGQSALAEAWANQLRDLLPRIGLRALVGVPEEVTALLALEVAPEPVTIDLGEALRRSLRESDGS